MKILLAQKQFAALVIAAALILTAVPGAVWAYSTGYPNTWKNTGDQAYDITQIALSQVGYTESSGNHTKYAAWYYGADKSVPWCSIFISWCANQAGISTNTIKKNALASGYGTASMSRNSFGAPAYAFSDTKAKAGDIIYVDNNSDGISNHTGLVYAVDDSYIYTVEGNSSSKVSQVKYSASSGHRLSGTRVSGARIVFFARPNYANSAGTPGSTSSESSSAEAESYVTGTYRVTASALNIRSAADLSARVLGEAHKGDVVTITETSGRWGAFSYKGQKAWLSLRYASLTESAAASSAGSSGTASSGAASGASTSAEDNYAAGTYRITASSLNVRSAPDTVSKILGVITEGTVVTVSKTSGRFGYITYRGQNAWVSLKYAEAIKSTSSGSTGTSSAGGDGSGYSTGNWMVDADTLYVRSGPDTSTELMGVAKKGETYTIVETNGRFGKTTFRGKTVWISLKYCRKVS